MSKTVVSSGHRNQASARFVISVALVSLAIAPTCAPAATIVWSGSVGGPSGKLIVSNTTGLATGGGLVSVEQSGTLSGSGFIAGPVQLRAGATIAPGDPVTPMLGDSLIGEGGGTIRLVLGADDAGSDHVDMQTPIRGGDGVFPFDLIDAGIVAGTTCELLHFANLVGFDAGDFTAHGVTGLFGFENGALDFLATAGATVAPEPATMTLLFTGLALVLAMSRRGRRRSGTRAKSSSRLRRGNGTC